MYLLHQHQNPLEVLLGYFLHQLMKLLQKKMFLLYLLLE
jgi:hypothetical protein